MSVRVCYLRRSDRGGLLKGLRLVGQEADESWPAEPIDSQARAQPAASVSSSQSAQTYDDAAAWIKRQLASTRSGVSTHVRTSFHIVSAIRGQSAST